MMGILSQKYYINYFLFLIVISSTIVFCEAIDDNIYDNDENSRSAAVDFSTNCIRGPVASMTPPITQNFIMKIGATKWNFRSENKEGGLEICHHSGS
jgi:hypothetical protein